MNVTYTDKAKQSAEEYALLQEATKRLEEVLGPASTTTRAAWDRTEDGQGRPLYTLRLSDWTGPVSASFAPDELASPSHMRFRLHHLWGNLLQLRNHRQLQELTEAGGAGE